MKLLLLLSIICLFGFLFPSGQSFVSLKAGATSLFRVNTLQTLSFAKKIGKNKLSSEFQMNRRRDMTQFERTVSTSDFELPSSSIVQQKVDSLLALIDQKEEIDTKEGQSRYEDDVKKLITDIENDSECLMSNEENKDQSLERFEKLIGLYTVDQVITKKKNENPVGGKWTRKNSLTKRLFKSRQTFQHIIASSKPSRKNNSSSTDDVSEPVVAQAVNVISFDALFGLIRITVMLRGDAVPLQQHERDELELTNYAVRAYFDPPRIVFGKKGRIFNIKLGPQSSVVLDATYVDDIIRIGKGGTSGSRFVFKRCDPKNPDLMKEANEFRTLLERKPMRRSKIITGLLGIMGLGAYCVKLGRIILGSIFLLCSGIGGLGLKFSTGGIEED